MASSVHHSATGLTLIISVLSLCATASAVEFAGGTGTPDDPYQIATAEQMNAIGADPNDWDKCFLLTNDLDMSEVNPNEIVPIGDTITPFSGVFDGAGHTITDFTCLQDQPNVGVFGVLMSPAPNQIGVLGIVKDLHLINAQVRGTDYVGGLVASNRGTVTACSIEGDVAGVSRVGGVVGSNYGEIDACRCVGTVTATTNTVGGIAAENVRTTPPAGSPPWSGNKSARILRSCSSAQVIGQSMVGGVVGSNSGTISHCYAEGSATGNPVGGIVGSSTGTLQFCYSTARVAGTGGAAGVAGINTYGTTSFCLWDIEASGVGISPAGKGKTTAEMKSATTYYCWGADGLWTLDEGNDYPRLAWENRGGRPIGEYDCRFGGGAGTADDPYQIRTVVQFITIAWYPEIYDKQFAIMADLDFNDANPVEIRPIGSDRAAFTGELDGRGHTLSHLTLSSYGNYVGVIGVLGTRVPRWPMVGPGIVTIDAPGYVHDLHVSDVRVNGHSDLGGLVGFLTYGTVSHCSITGSVGSDSAGGLVGGLVGRSMGLITNCRTSCIVKGRDFVGGLAGSNYGTIELSYSTGEVTGRNYHVGGLSGENSGVISCCYSHCTVEGGEGVGGLVGSGSGRILFSYATGKVIGKTLVGGLLGQDYKSTPCVHCYWDVETSGVSTSGGGAIGKTTAELQARGTFSSWGGGVWAVDAGHDYPHLAWEGSPGMPIVYDPGRYGGGTGSVNDPYQIQTARQFANIARYPQDYDKHFALMADIDLAGIGDVSPIGDRQLPFSGVFDGRHHVIRNFACNRPTTEWVGIFGVLDSVSPHDNIVHATVKDVNAVGLDVRGGTNAGGLVGWNLGTVQGCSISGRVTATRWGGGLVAYNRSLITASRFQGSVDASECAGGLVGSDLGGTIQQCSAAATVVGSTAGGLVGSRSGGTIEQCWAAGQVKGTSEAGGLAGFSSGTIAICHADTRTEGGRYVGGLVGSNGGDVTDCSAGGEVIGSDIVGGLIGYHRSGTATDCFADARVTGLEHVGGLVGWNWAKLVRCRATVTVLAPQRGERVGGLVGINYWGARIIGCHAGGTVTAGPDSTLIGGLAGENGGGQILDSYATTEVTAGNGSRYIGGLVGSNIGEYQAGGTVGRCYAAGLVVADGCEEVGGLAGYDQSRVFLSCWDVQATGQVTSAAGTAKTTDEMMQAETFIGWGCDGLWVLNPGRDYPRLAWENTPGIVITDPLRAYGGGSGTVLDPYQIHTAEQLNTIGLYWPDHDKHYILMADVAFDSNVPFNCIGSEETPFSGSFEGNEHIVTNLYCPDAQGAGMFGCIRSEDANQPAVARLTLVNTIIRRANSHAGCLASVLDHSTIVGCVVKAGSVYANSHTGGLVGHNDAGAIQGCRFEGSVVCKQVISGTGGLAGYSSGKIEDCQVSDASVHGYWNTGGLVGEVNGVEVVNCHAAAVVTADSTCGGLVGKLVKGRIHRCHAEGKVSAQRYTGGLVGACASETVVSQCCAAAEVSGYPAWVGGLIGSTQGAVSDCYAIGPVSVNVKGSAVGGLVGSSGPGILSRCYAAGAVTVGDGSTYYGPLSGSASSVHDCYYLAVDDGPAAKYGTPLTDEQMHRQATFVGWDFETVWSICEGKDYPRLRWEEVECNE